MGGSIEPGDRVTYAEATEICGRSHRYLALHAQRGELSRDGGGPTEVFDTWLSRPEVEALALRDYRPGHATDYWLTMTESAELLEMARQNAHRARLLGRLPAQRAANGHWLVRRVDALALYMARP